MPTDADTARESSVPERITLGFGARAALGGVLMGLANLVPGISGGTMLVAAGVYRAFIDAVADVTRLRLRKNSVIVIAIIVAAALAAIVAFAGVVAYGLTEFRWGMYALFIGLTLGGAPVLIRMARPFSAAVWGGLVAGAVVMGALVWAQSTSDASGGAEGGWPMLVVGGAAGASAMILPGVSGAYLLLLLGQYERIIGAIKDGGRAATDMDTAGMLDAAGVVVPVGLGVLVGVVVVANVLRFVLHRYEKAALGVLLGLLLAAPAGLYPFKQAVPPEVGETVKGELVTPDNRDEMRDPSNAKDWREVTFTPGAARIAGATGLIVVGFGLTLGVSRLGRGQSDGAGTGDDASTG
ncbi:MAG: hypothetical protein DHS20C14_15090 [Phycisphaeraceae bacterium]|nr:MAG: hypothetical protein DHS20C14_15090 [Phycisphaeraceae bacterium]